MYALIIGGTRGLGREIKWELQKRGIPTIAIGRSLEDNNPGRVYSGHNRKFLFDLDDSSGKSLLTRCDLSDASEVTRLVGTLLLMSLPINLVFWCAAVMRKGPLTSTSVSKYWKMIDANFRNPLALVQFAWEQFHKGLKDEQTRLCVISSSSGVKEKLNEAVYVATKHAQVGFTRSLGLESTNPNCRVSLILPGGMKTALWRDTPTREYDQFLDPKLVAQKIVRDVLEQEKPYLEVSIPRGSLV